MSEMEDCPVSPLHSSVPSVRWKRQDDIHVHHVVLNPSQQEKAHRSFAGAQYSPVASKSLSDWPTQPRLLRNRFGSKKGIFLFVWDLTITLTPLIFIVVALCALSLNKQPASGYGKNILDAEKLGPTLFPIVFAAIVGRLMSALARWRAERGSQLGLLEQLTGSQSLFTALERMFRLRRWGVIGISIVLLWALSPLGGQGSLRLLSISPSTYADSASVRYMNTNMSFAMFGSDDFRNGLAQYQAVYLASLLTSPAVRSSPIDTWGNVKIPMIELLPGYDAKNLDNPWLSVPENNANFSALVGLNTIGLPNVTASGFVVESSYLTMDCLPFHQVNLTADNALYNAIGPLMIHQNDSQITDPVYNPVPSTSLNPDWILDLNAYSQPYTLPNIIYAKYHEPLSGPNSLPNGNIDNGQADDNLGAIWTNCTVRQVFVQSNVSCTGLSCGVSHMRRSLANSANNAAPLFPDLVGLMQILSTFPFFGNAGTSSDNLHSMSLTYIQDPTAVIFEQLSLTGYNIIGYIPAKDFSVRLSQLLNTFVQICWSPSYLSGGAPNDIAAYGNQTLPWAASQDVFVHDGGAEDQPPFPNNATIAQLLRQGPEVYHASFAWVTVVLFVSLLMQCCAIATIILKYQCNGPTILGFVSSLTRDNPHVEIPPGGTTLDGLDRARLLNDMYVQVADVQEKDGVGHIALTSHVGSSLARYKDRLFY